MIFVFPITSGKNSSTRGAWSAPFSSTAVHKLSPSSFKSSHLQVPIIQQKCILVFYRFQYNGMFTKKGNCSHPHFAFLLRQMDLFQHQHFIYWNTLDCVCTYIHIQTHRIKSIETYCSLYLEKFKISSFKSGIYQMLFHTVTLMEFASFGFEPTGIRLRMSLTLLSHTILLLIPEMNPIRLLLILLKAEADVMVSVHVSDRG